MPALEIARTLQTLHLPACPLLSESGTAVTHCNPSPDRATALAAAPGRQESQSDWLGACRELLGRAAFLTWEAQGDLCSQLPPKQVRTRALHRPSLWPNYFHSCPHTLPITAGIEMPITAHAFQRHCPVCQQFRGGKVAEQERKSFASPPCEVESNLVGIICIWGRPDERMGQGGSLTADTNTQLGLHPCTPVHWAEGSALRSISRLPARPQQQGCDREKLCQKQSHQFPSGTQHCMWRGLNVR